MVIFFTRGGVGSILRWLGAGWAVAVARRVLFLAVRTARHRGGAAAEDGFEIATLRAGRVRAAMLGLGVGQGAEWTGRCGGLAALDGVAEFPALGALV
jgi:hypothetical protein